MSMPGYRLCLVCGQPFHRSDRGADKCALCSGEWEAWEVRFPPLPLARNREQVAAWVAQLPFPSCVEILARGADGIRLRLHLPPGGSQGVIHSWSAMTHQQSMFVRLDQGEAIQAAAAALALQKSSPVPDLTVAASNSDPLLAIGGQLLSGLGPGESASLRIWISQKNTILHEKIRTLASYNYGTASGVEDEAPNPWSFELVFLRAGAFMAGAVVAAACGLGMAGVIDPLLALIAVIAGIFMLLPFAAGLRNWSLWRSIPKTTLEAKARDALLDVAITYRGSARAQPRLSLISGRNTWRELTREWPQVTGSLLPVGSLELAALFCPPELGEGSGIISSAVIQNVPASVPSSELRDAPFKVGVSVRTGEEVGVDPDGHGVAVGGTRSGKSSFVYDLLKQLIRRGEDAPGMFIVDPHLSLSDAILQDICELPEPLRANAIRRLRIISPDRAEVIPLNLLALPDFAWAGNTMVQMGKRIWDDYWGPRMQAALLGLFRLVHIWNMNNPTRKMGLIHVVFSAFNTDWRHLAMGYLPPFDRFNSLGLDALLGQFAGHSTRWDQGWVTEVISPVLSKVMALELSPWLFSAMHQDRFVDMERWVDERAWIILRLPSGTMGRESARLTASIVYNIFDAAFHKKTAVSGPIPFFFVVDEAQEIAAGMQLESLLSEGAKFGARLFVLTQSLTMMRKTDGFEAVVQGLLANTSTQAFFSPDPEDADLIRSILNTSLRFGNVTFDLKTLTCWLRTRLQGGWQSPTLVRVNPLRRSDPGDIQQLISEVIAAHPEDYASGNSWQATAIDAMMSMIPESKRYLLSALLLSDMEARQSSQSIQSERAAASAQASPRARIE